MASSRRRVGFGDAHCWWSIALLMETASIPETPVKSYQITRRNTQKTAISILATVRIWNLTFDQINLGLNKSQCSQLTNVLTGAQYNRRAKCEERLNVLCSVKWMLTGGRHRHTDSFPLQYWPREVFFRFSMSLLYATPLSKFPITSFLSGKLISN
jgi:hypothetical protein